MARRPPGYDVRLVFMVQASVFYLTSALLSLYRWSVIALSLSQIFGGRRSGTAATSKGAFMSTSPLQGATAAEESELVAAAVQHEPAGGWRNPRAGFLALLGAAT